MGFEVDVEGKIAQAYLRKEWIVRFLNKCCFVDLGFVITLYLLKFCIDKQH